MTKQPEALRLADRLDPLTRKDLDNLTCSVASVELRRLHEANAELLAAFKDIASTPWVENILDPQRAGRVARAAINKAIGETK